MHDYQKQMVCTELRMHTFLSNFKHPRENKMVRSGTIRFYIITTC